MDCRDVAQIVVLKLTGEISPEEGRELDRHLQDCPPCRAEATGLREAWDRLGEDAVTAPTRSYSAATLSRMAKATLGRRPEADSTLAPWASWATWPSLRRVAALVVMGVGGFASARFFASAPPPGPAPSSRPPVEAVVPVSATRVLDASRALPDLSSKPRLVDVAYQTLDGGAKVAVSFDVTTRYTMVGRPDEKGIEQFLAYVVSGSGGNEGARGKALDLVARSLASEGASPSAEIVAVLAKTLATDRNPGVRKKAAEALAQMTPTSETRDALTACLKTEVIPGIRILAVEGLAKAAETLKDRQAIETLQEKANDERESGYVRVKAASALGRLAL